MSIFDQILGAEMANEYTDSQRLAHEKKTVITWDGNTEGKETIEHEMFQYLYKISDEGIDVENIKSMMLYDGRLGKASECIAKTSVLHEGSLQMLIYDETAPAVLSTKENFSFDEGLEVKKGTYFYGAQDTAVFFVESITIETVHQIDKKFIPGYIPVLELTTGFSIENRHLDCTAEESAILQMASDSKMPVVVRFNIDGVDFATMFIFQCLEGTPSFSFSLAGLNFDIMYEAGSWRTSVSGRIE